MSNQPKSYPQSTSAQLLTALDFTDTQKQVDALMKSVIHDNTLNEHKIKFIQEQLYDQRYQINPKLIAKKMFEHLDHLEVQQTELSAEQSAF